MQIQLSYFAQIRHATGESTLTLTLDDQATVLQALSIAADRYGDSFRKLILSGPDQIQPGIILLVNGIPVSTGIKTTLNNGDSVSLFSPVAGG